MPTETMAPRLRRTTGALFVAGALTFAGAATVLSSTFDWPDILREPADVWGMRLLSAQQHTELAQTLRRRGELDRSRELAIEAIAGAAAARELTWEPEPAEADRAALVPGLAGHPLAQLRAEPLDRSVEASATESGRGARGLGRGLGERQRQAGQHRHEVA